LQRFANADSDPFFMLIPADAAAVNDQTSGDPTAADAPAVAEKDSNALALSRLVVQTVGGRSCSQVYRYVAVKLLAITRTLRQE
jgi:hypothetical protein